MAVSITHLPDEIYQTNISRPASTHLTVHALVLDGVSVEDGGILQFHEAPPPTDDEIDRLLRTIDRRVHRLLARRGVLDDLVFLERG